MTRSSLTIRLVAVSAVAPLVVAGIGIALMLDWLPQVTGPIVVHWGVSGHSVGPADAYPILIAAIVVPLVVVLTAILVGSVRAGSPSVQQKFIAVIPLWLSVFLTGSSAALLFLQRGSHLVDNPAPELLVAFGAGIVIAFGGWFLLPPAATQSPNRMPVKARTVAAGERVAWLGRTSASLATVIPVVALAALLLAAAIVVTFFVSTTGLLLLVPAIILGLSSTILEWHVSIDERGLVARGLLGLPRYRVPLDDVANTAVVDINPLADFGGWGLRFGLGKRVGIVLRTGRALEVLRKSAGSLVITMPDATAAAEVLAGLAAR
ncbi:MAG: hypothetical protein JWN80_1746 [Microbacteriaceae bacterium]|nr:hypothetical protein [Microbacteriaceae bacterium]